MQSAHETNALEGTGRAHLFNLLKDGLLVREFGILVVGQRATGLPRNGRYARHVARHADQGGA